MEIRHGVGLADFVLRELIEVGLNKRAILTIVALGALVGEPGRHGRLLLRKRVCIVWIQLVRS